MRGGWLLVVAMVLWAVPGLAALLPEQVLVVANRSVPASVALADAYMKARGIPEGNLFLAWLPDKENIPRDLYDSRVRDPLREFFATKVHRPIRCLVTMYGMPLSVSGPQLNFETQQQVKALEARIKDLDAQAKAQKGEAQARLTKEYHAARAELDKVAKRGVHTELAALDSELSLLLAGDYPLEGWQPNPLFIANQRGGKPLAIKADRVLLVSRLDAPTPEIARRMLADSLATEAEGLQGKAYFDARWHMPEDPKAVKDGYGFYDLSIHLAAKRVQDSGLMPVVLDEQQTLFQPGSAPDAALYCGWYSLSQYVPAFTWKRGAVGYHIASGELGSLRNKNNQWCQRMLEDGVAATLGPVSEPYVQAFPIPEAFFALLTSGKYTLAESYFLTLPWLSWQMALLGDPLYNPFLHRAGK